MRKQLLNLKALAEREATMRVSSYITTSSEKAT
jgi:hypothetical protein